MKLSSSPIVLATGGTGGHVIPALALAEELIARGHRVSVISDERGLQYIDQFGAAESHVIPTGRFAGVGTWGRLKAIGRVVTGTLAAWRILRELRPVAVIGFGGYPSLPTMLAASVRGLPGCLHEQNAVLGRVNRFLMPWIDALALSFAETARVPRGKRARLVVTGNPVRREVAHLAARPYPNLTVDGEFRLLVIGGSQGATIMGDVVPAALSVLPRSIARRLKVIQQCRPEDIERVRARYRATDITVELDVYILDLPEKLAAAHLVIARAGASTVSELTAAGRPAILVPLPGAMDDHQTANVRELAAAGGAWLMPQRIFTPADLAKRLRKLITKPEDLATAAVQARAMGIPQAAARLADLVDWMVRVRGARRAGHVKARKIGDPGHAGNGSPPVIGRWAA